MKGPNDWFPDFTNLVQGYHFGINPVQMNDIRIGFHVAKATSDLDIGQTVIVKQGTILAVEAFEGTDATILRAGKLGGQGAVLIKVAKPGHDMRFDIPVIGLHTIKSLRKAKIGAVAVEAGKAILLEREEIIRRMDALDIAFIVMNSLTSPGNQKQ